MGRLVDTYTHNDLPPQFMSIMETASKAGYDTYRQRNKSKKLIQGNALKKNHFILQGK